MHRAWKAKKKELLTIQTWEHECDELTKLQFPSKTGSQTSGAELKLAKIHVKSISTNIFGGFQFTLECEYN